MYFAKTMPAGHSWPPHPEERSSWSFRGGSRSLSKLMLVVDAGLWIGDWISSSLTSKVSSFLSDMSGCVSMSMFLWGYVRVEHPLGVQF